MSGRAHLPTKCITLEKRDVTVIRDKFVEVHPSSTVDDAVPKVAFTVDQVVAKVAPTIDETVTEGASTADEVVAKGASTVDKAVAEVGGEADEVVAEVVAKVVAQADEAVRTRPWPRARPCRRRPSGRPRGGQRRGESARPTAHDGHASVPTSTPLDEAVAKFAMFASGCQTRS